MSNEMLSSLTTGLNGYRSEEGTHLSATQMSDNGVDLIKVEVEDREEFPIFISVDDEQLLCTTYLWHQNEVKPEQRSEMLEAMITMNLPMPLSSFGKVGDQYLLFGAMALGSQLDEVIHEVCILSDNCLSAIEAMHDYLN